MRTNEVNRRGKDEKKNTMTNRDEESDEKYIDKGRRI
jgi:hypothetical protein